jgi:hypothetical protein
VLLVVLGVAGYSGVKIYFDHQAAIKMDELVSEVSEDAVAEILSKPTIKPSKPRKRAENYPKSLKARTMWCSFMQSYCWISHPKT